MLAPEAEVEVDVRREDQQKINEFGRNNAKLAEIEQDLAAMKSKLQVYDDANTELMMGDGDDVQVLIGDTFINWSEESTTEYLEQLVEKTQKKVDELTAQEEKLQARQAVLKKALYSRFGQSINLEN